jgi:hypothetical protein
MTDPLLFTIVFLAALLQTTSGFGFALMAMPLVALVIGVKAAAPLVALTGSHPLRGQLWRAIAAASIGAWCCRWLPPPRWGCRWGFGR